MPYLDRLPGRWRTTYPGREEHVGFLVDFLRRCSRIKWQAGDLRNVLEFLIVLDGAESKGKREIVAKHAAPGRAMKLLAKLAAEARAKFPDQRILSTGRRTRWRCRKGPRKCNRRLRGSVSSGPCRLAEGANDPDGVGLAKLAKEKLFFLDELERRAIAGPVPPLPFTAAG